jgi:hypothetical protein
MKVFYLLRGQGEKLCRIHLEPLGLLDSHQRWLPSSGSTHRCGFEERGLKTFFRQQKSRRFFATASLTPNDSSGVSSLLPFLRQQHSELLSLSSEVLAQRAMHGRNLVIGRLTQTGKRRSGAAALLPPGTSLPDRGHVYSHAP